jgi:hypothetical protein
MKKMNKLMALTTVMALFAGQVQGQGQEYYDDTSAAYEDSGKAATLSALLPLGALAAAAIIIAVTDRHHHHHGNNNNNSNNSHSHNHSGFVQ